MSIESTIHFACYDFQIGSFHCRPGSELWRQENVSGEFPLIVFPRTAVEIHQHARSPVIATPNHAMFYNAQQVYHRDMIDVRGDVCEFFRVSPGLLEEAMHSVGAREEQSQEPFAFSHGPCRAPVYLRQRELFGLVSGQSDLQQIQVREMFFSLLPILLGDARQFFDPFDRKRKEGRALRREKVEATKDYLARNFRNKVTIGSVAQYVECSEFHLCRIFRKLTGHSIHDFVVELRLRTALERIVDSSDSLTTIAFDFNFSSHSHFTNAFRKRFGIAPSSLRA